MALRRVTHTNGSWVLQVGEHLARCELAASGSVREISVNATARAGADAAAYACHGDTATVNVDVIARSTATALAQATAQADVFCETRGGEDTMACGMAEADVRAVASAQVCQQPRDCRRPLPTVTVCQWSHCLSLIV